MIVPAYWAEAKDSRHIDGQLVTVRRFGWADASQAAAKTYAEERLADAFTRMASGENVPRRDRKVPYNGAEGMPIREEVIERVDDHVITRNSYGALCLNTPDVVFVDVDLPEQPTSIVGCLAFLALSGVSGYLSFKLASLDVLFIGLIIALFSASFIGRIVDRVKTWLVGSPATAAEARIKAFSETHPDWHLRVYRSPAGYRVLVMHHCFEPESDACRDIFSALLADPMYVTMCKRQHCFRARISPKPWRIGINQRLRPRPGVWPIDPEWMPAREAWVSRYNKQAEGFSSCHFLFRLGAEHVDPRCELIRAIHDRFSQSDQVLPMG